MPREMDGEYFLLSSQRSLRPSVCLLAAVTSWVCSQSQRLLLTSCCRPWGRRRSGGGAFPHLSAHISSCTGSRGDASGLLEPPDPDPRLLGEGVGRVRSGSEVSGGEQEALVPAARPSLRFCSPPGCFSARLFVCVTTAYNHSVHAPALSEAQISRLSAAATEASH